MPGGVMSGSGPRPLRIVVSDPDVKNIMSRAPLVILLISQALSGQSVVGTGTWSPVPLDERDRVVHSLGVTRTNGGCTEAHGLPRALGGEERPVRAARHAEGDDRNHPFRQRRAGRCRIPFPRPEPRRSIAVSEWQHTEGFRDPRVLRGRDACARTAGGLPAVEHRRDGAITRIR